MKLPRRNFLHLAASAAALPAVSRFAWAQSYPTRPVRIIVAFAPGGVSDVTARLISQWLLERLGQQFVIDNRPGGEPIALRAIARDIARRMIDIFLLDKNQRRPVYGGAPRFADDPSWRDHLLFYEYFHGDNGAGIGASHHTGWTALVANLIDEWR